MQAHSDDPDYLQKNYHTGLTFSHQASLSAGSFAKNVYHCNWPVFKFVSCFFLICLCFQGYFGPAIVYIHHNARSPNQAADCSSKLHLLFLPSRHLLFSRWRPTRQPHVARLSQLEQIPTNLGQISTGCPICKN